MPPLPTRGQAVPGWGTMFSSSKKTAKRRNVIARVQKDMGKWNQGALVPFPLVLKRVQVEAEHDPRFISLLQCTALTVLTTHGASREEK